MVLTPPVDGYYDILPALRVAHFPPGQEMLAPAAFLAWSVSPFVLLIMRRVGIVVTKQYLIAWQDEACSDRMSLRAWQNEACSNKVVFESVAG